MILGIMGKAGAGKDTFADILVRDHGFVKVGLADPMKRFCREVFDFSDAQMWGPSEMRNAPDPRFDPEMSRPNGVPLSPRRALQTLGTEWGRACYENVWIDYALRVASAIEDGHGYDQKRGVTLNDGVGGNVVIPDVRFKNEFDAITAAGGRVLRIVRALPGANFSGHASETEQDSIVCTETFANQGTIADMERHIAGWLGAR